MKFAASSRILSIVVAAAAAYAILQLLPAKTSGRIGSSSLARQFVGNGRWESHQTGNGPHGWQVQMKRFDDDSLSGRAVIVGSPLMQQVQIRGQVTGTEVDGVLLDDNGVQVGTFSGTAGTNGLTGTYTTADGDIGNWSWDGPTPTN